MKDTKYIITDNVKLYPKKQNLTQFELAEKADRAWDQNNIVRKFYENSGYIGCSTIISHV